MFVSSHKPVRQRLQRSNEIVVAITPAPTTEMETIWCDKLKARHEQSKLEKDLKAYSNTLACYKKNVNEIMKDTNITVMIRDPKYKLDDIIFILNNEFDLEGVDFRLYVNYAARKLSTSPHAITVSE